MPRNTRITAEYAENRRTRGERATRITQRHLHRLVCLLPFAFGVAGAAHQGASQFGVDSLKAASIETDHLTIKLSSRDQGSAARGRMSLVVDIAPKPKMHVYAPEQKEYIPVKLTVDANDAYKLHAATYPPAEKFFFKPLNETQLVYSKPFRIVQELSLAAGERGRSSTLTITGTLRYQACDDAICYLPKNVPLTWTVTR